MNQRSYNKLYVNKNREEGSEGIALGYQYDEHEIILHKDSVTYFHVPLFADPLNLVDTDLVVNGAIAGAFPAVADRIFKSQKGYGDTTPHGNSSTVNGMWFCSWLYRNPTTGAVQWMDRFYQPGSFDYNTAINQLFDKPDYIKNDPVFTDVKSTMVFEPGVLYRYFHLGEKTADEILSTLEGPDGTRLKMHLLNWGTDKVDRSSNGLNVSVHTDAEYSSLIYSLSSNDNVRIFNSTIDFDNNYNVNTKIDYNSNYLSENEFTWAFWGYSKDWQGSQSTQLIGNLSTKGGGIGVFLETLETFPFIAIPETKYGHVIFVNENGSAYLDKSVQSRYNSVSPICYGIDSNNRVVVCNKDSSGVIYKLDHAGHVTKTTKNVADVSTSFVFPLSGEIPKQLLCGLNDDFYVVTNQAIHSFDTNLIHKSSIGIATENEDYTKAAFRYDISLNTFALDVVTNVYDVKFVEQTKWSISSIDGNLYKDDVLFYEFSDTATTFSIGPDNNIWVAHGINNITVLSPTSALVVRTLDSGSSTIEIGKSRKKNTSFTKQYNRKTGKSEWSFVVYYSDEKLLYFYTLAGKLSKRLDLNTAFDPVLIQRLSQKIEESEFLSTGDFTGYERQRIFSKLSPYSNSPQICIKASVQDTSKPTLIYNSPISSFASIADWEKDSWKHFVLVYKNKIASLFCNGVKLTELELSGHHRLNFDSQPSFFIGSPTGSVFGFNSEVKYVSNIFNGKIGDVRVFDYAVSSELISMFVRASNVAQDLIWPVPIPTTQYVEHIERMFKHKLPGSKSQFFNLKLIGTGITDSNARDLVEEEVSEMIENTKPAYADLVKIEWVN